MWCFHSEYFNSETGTKMNCFEPCWRVCVYVCMHYVCTREQNESWLTNSGPKKQKGVSPILCLILHIIFLRPVCGLLLFNSWSCYRWTVFGLTTICIWKCLKFKGKKKSFIISNVLKLTYTLLLLRFRICAARVGRYVWQLTATADKLARANHSAVQRYEVCGSNV